MINDAVVAELTSPPWVINAPDGLSGQVRVEARATDNVGTQSSSGVRTVTIDDTLVDFGGDCDSDDACVSRLCAFDSEGNGTCTESCVVDAEDNGCPSGYECQAAGNAGVCWPKSSSGGVCSAAGPSTPASALLMFLGVYAWRRRKKRSLVQN